MILKNKPDGGRRTTDNGRRTTDDGQRTRDNRPPATVNSGLWSAVCGHRSVVGGQRSVVGGRILIALMLMAIFNFATCKYGFKDIGGLPTEVKTFRVNYFENKADYKNPQLSPQLTEKLKAKIISTTRLRQTNDDDAHYDISGYVSNYYTSTTGISNNNTSLNRLTATFHLVFKNTLDQTKNFESDVTYSVDFDGNLSLSQVEQQKGEEIFKNLTDAIFNKIFSNW